MKDLTVFLNQQKQKLRYRVRRITTSAQQAEISIDSKKVINFCSNDYLGLANHPKVKQSMVDAIKTYGVGTGASHLICGHTASHHLLEQELAQFCGYPRALVFSTGYMANLGLCQALVQTGDSIFQDRLNHASLLDGSLLSRAKSQRYLHNNPASLQKKLDKVCHKNTEKLVLTDGVFSMDGDIAPLTELASLCKKSASWLMVDDAHGFGVLAKTGKGIRQHFNLSTDDIPIYMATFGKAVGTSGAFIAGSDALIETLIQKARSYIYSTAMPAAIAQATRTSLKIMQQEPEHLANLQANIHYFNTCCKQNNIAIGPSETAIFPLIIGDDKKLLSSSQQLFEQGFLVTAIRPPTVKEGTSRLRITLSASHTRLQIDAFCDALKLLNLTNN